MYVLHFMAVLFLFRMCASVHANKVMLLPPGEGLPGSPSTAPGSQRGGDSCRLVSHQDKVRRHLTHCTLGAFKALLLRTKLDFAL